MSHTEKPSVHTNRQYQFTESVTKQKPSPYAASETTQDSSQCPSLATTEVSYQYTSSGTTQDQSERNEEAQKTHQPGYLSHLPVQEAPYANMVEEDEDEKASELGSQVRVMNDPN